jgi:proteasome accessory factor C
MTAPTPTVRFHRLLAIIPWVVARGGATVDELCARFDLTRDQLLADLDLLWFVGTPPYSPSDLIEVDVHEDVVTISYADSFTTPLKLTPEQGLALVAAAHALASVPGADPEGPLARALAKVSRALDVDGKVGIDLGPVHQELLDDLRAAVSERAVVELDYLSHNRDARTLRAVEPEALFLDQGAWYLAAHCRLADAPRTFRVERILALTRTGEHLAAPSTETPSPGRVSVGSSGGEQVVLELQPSARWVLEQVAYEDVQELADGAARVTLVSTARPWLERLLLRLGDSARVVAGDPTVASSAASRVLERYRRGRVGTAPSDG